MSEKRIVRAAAVQISPDFERSDGTLNKVCEAIDQAAREGVQLIVFPETFVPYYPYFSFVRPPVASGADHMRLYEEAVVVPGPVTQAVAERARLHGMVVVLGVNERDYGSLYNTQLIFDVDGQLLLKRRKITPTFHERMIWGQGDAAGLKVVQTAVARVGALACWEHYNPLARYALMTQHEEIHCSQFPGSLVGPIFAEQIEVTIRHHALESGCFVVNATPEGATRRLQYGDRLARRPASGRAAARGRGHGDRRYGHGVDHQAQTHDGFGRALRAAGTAQSSDQRTAGDDGVADAVVGRLWHRLCRPLCHRCRRRFQLNRGMPR
jgi:putative nitrilase